MAVVRAIRLAGFARGERRAGARYIYAACKSRQWALRLATTMTSRLGMGDRVGHIRDGGWERGEGLLGKASRLAAAPCSHFTNLHCACSFPPPFFFFQGTRALSASRQRSRTFSILDVRTVPLARNENLGPPFIFASLFSFANLCVTINSSIQQTLPYKGADTFPHPPPAPASYLFLFSSSRLL